jgi:hypothetical protein
VNKTQSHIPSKQHITYTYGVYSEKTANARKTDLFGTFYRWNDTTGGHYTTVCSRPKQHLKVPKKSVYARVDPGTETYLFGCPSGPTVFYGDVWTNKTGVPGNVDTFRSSLIGHFGGPSGKYEGTLNFDVHVTIAQ